MAVDPGVVVQPNKSPLRLESGMMFGLGAALIEQFAIKDGVMQATNFDSYPVLRMADMPEIHTKIVASTTPRRPALARPRSRRSPRRRQRDWTTDRQASPRLANVA